MINDNQLKINAARSQAIQEKVSAWEKKGNKVYKAARGESAYSALFYSFDRESLRLTEKK